MKSKRLFNIQDLQRELESIAKAVGTQKTKADYHKWLVRLCKAATMTAIIWREYDLRPSRDAEKRAEEKTVLAEIPDALNTLNVCAQQALSRLRDL